MRLSTIAAIIEDRSPYPLQSIRRAPGSVIAVIGSTLPDGQEAVSSLAISGLELDEARYVNELIAERVHAAAESMSRYIASFAPAPKWDEQRWA